MPRRSPHDLHRDRCSRNRNSGDRASCRGEIPRNRIMGVRTRATLANDTAWRVGHRAATLPMALTGGAAIVGGTVSAVLGYVNEPFIVVILAFILLSGAAWSSAAARRATQG
ncbi:SdpI family protein [Microbacterium sp. H83]|uniref:SdpI family protein n=1 Tax=Microbacterium sp. H83 TaxID=1827324 RepID=UPI0009EE524E